MEVFDALVLADYFHHVKDARFFELPFGQHAGLPTVFGIPLTKFMVLQVVAFLLTLFIFRGLAKRARSGQPVKGRFWNFWESVALFVRDEVVRPTIGDPHHHDDHGDGDHHDAHAASAHPEIETGGHPADKYLPFIWSCFFYILFCNLLGAIPFLGSATGNINVTGSLALTAFFATTVFSIQAIGGGGFIKNFLGGLEINGAMDVGIACILFPIEVVGYLIKHGVLAVRLFANIMGGHTVLGVMLFFIADTAMKSVWYMVAPASVLGQVAIGMLELFVAFLQAYVFSFLATIFIASGLHEH